MAARHLESLSDFFPRFDPQHIRDCGFVAALANDPLAGISALIAGRVDCLVIAEPMD